MTSQEPRNPKTKSPKPATEARGHPFTLAPSAPLHPSIRARHVRSSQRNIPPISVASGDKPTQQRAPKHFQEGE